MSKKKTKRKKRRRERAREREQIQIWDNGKRIINNESIAHH